MKTLYLCGAGNPEGVRLALSVNRTDKKWDKIVILDDDPAKHGQSILGIKIRGPFGSLEEAEPDSDEVVNLVSRTTRGRQSAMKKIASFGLSFATLIDPGVDVFGVEMERNITVYQGAILCANASIGEGSVVFMHGLVGHGAHVGRGCVVAPGAVINARVELADGVYIGSNASILPDLKVGVWATVGANSSVVQDVPAETTAVGVPAQLLMPHSGRQKDSAGKKSITGQPDPDVSKETPINVPNKQKIMSESLVRLRRAKEGFIKSHRSRNLLINNDR